jgi:hypothetical protein
MGPGSSAEKFSSASSSAVQLRRKVSLPRWDNLRLAKVLKMNLSVHARRQGQSKSATAPVEDQVLD